MLDTIRITRIQFKCHGLGLVYTYFAKDCTTLIKKLYLFLLVRCVRIYLFFFNLLSVLNSKIPRIIKVIHMKNVTSVISSISLNDMVIC